MRNSEFFYFLWDDPLFTEEVGNPIDWVNDPEFIELRRGERLLALELIYMKIDNLQRQLAQEQQFHREAQAREIWTINKFVTEVPSDRVEAILIDRKVNDMDPDFSFVEAITT